jgi:DNA processing protein
MSDSSISEDGTTASLVASRAAPPDSRTEPLDVDEENAVTLLALVRRLDTRRSAPVLRPLIEQKAASIDWPRAQTILTRRGLTDRPNVDLEALRRQLEHEVHLGRSAGMRLVPVTSERYPFLLRLIDNPPIVLWVSGHVATLTKPSVAIVGARFASSAALGMARELARDLAASGLIVVSGMARGVDGAAHRGALERGSTVAVLGGGIDVPYPREHRQLAALIASRGALVTEFPPRTPPLPHHFPLRNRIVAGLSLGVVVIEAGEASGALITARAALDQGKEVMVVPGLACTGRNRGGHALIKDGAALVENARDVWDALRSGSFRASLPPATSQQKGASSATPQGPDVALAKEWATEELVVTPRSPLPPRLQDWRPGEELDLDDLQQLAALELPRLLAALLEWELAGEVTRTPAGRFVRLSR